MISAIGLFLDIRGVHGVVKLKEDFRKSDWKSDRTCKTPTTALRDRVFLQRAAVCSLCSRATLHVEPYLGMN